MPDEEHTDETPDAAGESGYLLLVGGLLLIISMALGWLWLTERSRRVDAERRAAKVQNELDNTRGALKALAERIIPRPTSRPSTRAGRN